MVAFAEPAAGRSTFSLDLIWLPVPSKRISIDRIGSSETRAAVRDIVPWPAGASWVPLATISAERVPVTGAVERAAFINSAAFSWEADTCNWNGLDGVGAHFCRPVD